jgi:arylsulfatase A-like enzyme
MLVKYLTVPLVWLITVALHAQDEPRWTSWLTHYSGTYARTYISDAAEASLNAVTTWSRGQGTQAQPTYAGIHEVAYDQDWVYIRTTGLGSHIMGPWPANFPNFPANTATIYRVPRTPTVPTTKDLSGLGAIGFFIDGVAMFDSRDAFSYSASLGRDARPNDGGNRGDGIWNRDAYVNEGPTFDPANAHQAGSQYHYHANPTGLRALSGDQVSYDPLTNTYTEDTSNLRHSPILAWVTDGFPLYGPYGYSAPLDPESGIRRMITGFQYRDGSNGSTALAVTGRTTWPAWAVRVQGLGPSVASGPSTSVNSLGHYMEDYAYLGDLGMTLGAEFDLDEHNGRFCKTPEFPGGIYAYFVGIEPDGTPKHPYNIGRSYYGADAGGSTGTIPAATTKVFEGGPETLSRASEILVATDELSIEWTMLEGAESYVLEHSTNLTDWVPVSGPITTNGNVLSMVGSQIPTDEDIAYYRAGHGGLLDFDDTGFDYTPPGGGGGGPTGSTVTLTIELPAGPPPLPPQAVTPTQVTMGGTPITFISRPTQATVEVSFDPGTFAQGTYNFVVTFPTPMGSIDVTAITTYTVEAPAPDTAHNVLLIIIDDWAIDSSHLYNADPGATFPPTPTIERLANNGILFANAYAQTLCSPTRACMLTGRHAFRHGVGAPVSQAAELSAAEFTLPEAFAAVGSPYALASFGKWHLTAGQNNAGDPNTIGGWPHFSGSLGGGVPDYFAWNKTVNGTTASNFTYTTSDTVNDAAAWIQSQGDDPWFAWIGFNAGHTPFHRPPTSLHSYATLPTGAITGADRRPAFEASIEALDTELDRLLQSVDTNKTTIILLGDNGTPRGVVQPPYNIARAKGSLYDGGTHVPFLVAGPGVANPGRIDTNLVHCIDVFSTVLELCGMNEGTAVPPGTAIDGLSLVPVLEGNNLGERFILCEEFGGNANNPGRTIRDDRYRLVKYDSGTEEFYDIDQDPAEGSNLLPTLSTAQQTHYDDLLAELSSLN